MIHMSHESVAWNLALGAALLTGAVRPRLLAGLLPGLGVFLGVLTVVSAVDVVAGRVDLERLATHLVLVLGFVLGVIVSRRARRDGDPEPTAGHGPRRTPWPGGGARTSGRAAGPRGTAARRRDAA